MKKIVFLLFVCVSLGVYSQDFSEKPLSYSVNLLKENVSSDYFNQKIPIGYEIVLSEPGKVVAEKKVGSRIYDIKCYYNKGKLISVVFTVHSEQIWDVLRDTENTEFIMTNEYIVDGVESYLYKNLDLGYNFLIIHNENKRSTICTLSIPKS